MCGSNCKNVDQYIRLYLDELDAPYGYMHPVYVQFCQFLKTEIVVVNITVIRYNTEIRLARISVFRYNTEILIHWISVFLYKTEIGFSWISVFRYNTEIRLAWISVFRYWKKH